MAEQVGRYNNALSLLVGHNRWVEMNTGLTNDAHVDRFIVNPDGVLANNRHFIADTKQEYHPNGDGTTEGQSIHMLGYLHAYLATERPEYLEKAIWYWEAYVKYFYFGAPIPSVPARWICNWILNAKEPVLANYPINKIRPTQGGYKCVPLWFVNGKAQIPHGAPFWGEWLDVFTIAHRGHMTWDAINASVQKIAEPIDWDRVYNEFRITDPAQVTDMTSGKAWVNWAGLLGKPNYTAIWGESGRAEEYAVESIVVWTNNRITGTKISEKGLPDAQRGEVVMKDKTMNGCYLVNYAARLPVELGGYMFARNETWHNRPINTPFLGSANQKGNAADGEVWFLDACYMLWRITGEERYKKALEAVWFTAHEYTYIDTVDKFFRQSTGSTTPFTDGISYSFSYPGTAKIEYGRDEAGYITIDAAESCQHFLEQQSVRFRVTKDSKLRTTYGGQGIGCKAYLDITPLKAPSPVPDWWLATYPQSTENKPKAFDIPLSALTRLINPKTQEEYCISDERTYAKFGGCTVKMGYETTILGNRAGTITSSFHPTASAGFIIGFWLLAAKSAPVESMTYRSDADFSLRITDKDDWNWYWVVPDTRMQWSEIQFRPMDLILSSYQPNANGRPNPVAPNYDLIGQLQFSLTDSKATNKTLDYYCVNELPELFDADDGYTMTYRVVLSGKDKWRGFLGDCTIEDFRLDSLAYCPGIIPFSNIYAEGTEQIGGWHGMPYPGYQWPMMYCIQGDNAYDLWFNNQVDFLYDSQIEYEKQVGELGPGCAAYIWNRWDNYKYGEPDTWTTFHWGDQNPWSGYQCRAYMAAARAWYELSMRGRPVPEKLSTYVDNWTRWLADFLRRSGGQTPTKFPPAPNPPYYTGKDFVGHMTGLWLAGASYSALAGTKEPEVEFVMETCEKELVAKYDITNIPGHPMNGGWSPWMDLKGGNGMAYGFYTGEIFRGLSTYILYRKHGAGYNMFARCKLHDWRDATLPHIDVAEPDERPISDIIYNPYLDGFVNKGV